MASKGVRVITYQGTRKVEAGYNLSHTTETLIGYTACWVQCFVIILLFVNRLFFFGLQIKIRQ